MKNSNLYSHGNDSERCSSLQEEGWDTDYVGAPDRDMDVYSCGSCLVSDNSHGYLALLVSLYFPPFLYSIV